MATLHLPLKSKWFYMTKSRVKGEDYREITPFWCARFLVTKYGQKKPMSWWKGRCFDGKTKAKTIEMILNESDFREFTHNKMSLGYPKADDLERNITLPHDGIEIRTGNPEWGAKPGVVYFCVMHGAYRMDCNGKQ